MEGSFLGEIGHLGMGELAMSSEDLVISKMTICRKYVQMGYPKAKTGHQSYEYEAD